MVKLKQVFFVASFSLATSILLIAQSNSSLVISVTDPNGNLVAGAPAVLSTDGDFRQNASGSDLGVISFRGLAAGRYLITLLVDGFKEYRSTVIEVKPGETKRLDIILELAEIESKVDVTLEDAADPTTSGNARDLRKEEINTLPTDPDELKRVLQAIAGPSLTGDEMQISVNGIPGATIPNKENIKLVRINRNVFSSQYEYSFGGGIEIFTDSDIKKISGWGGFNFNDARLNATSPYIGRRVPYQSRSFWYGFSAPLSKKSSITLYSNYNDSESSSVVNAIVLDQDFNPVEFRESYQTPRFSNYNDVYFNWDPNKKHKFVGVFSFEYGKADNSDLGGFSLESRANRNRNLGLSLAFTETYIINPNFVNSTRFSGRFDKNSTRGSTAAAAINVSEAFLGGGSQTDQETNNSRFEIYNDTTKKLGRLNFGFGGSVRGYRIEEISRSNFGGTYTFSGRTAPTLDANFQPVRDGSGNVIKSPITSLETYRRTLQLRNRGLNPSQIRALGGGADQFTIAGGRPDLSVNQIDYAIYQQNNFGLSETTGISFGLRYENQTNIRSRTNLAPRFGFTWSPKTKEKQKPERTLPKITVGYGLFYTRFGINNALSELQANSPERSYYFITDAAVLDRFPDAPSVSELQQSATLRSLRLIDDEIQSPRQNIVNINITKSLWQGLSVNAGYTRTYTSRSILTRNINAPLAAAAGSTAPPIFPFGNSRNVYETRSVGRNRSDRLFISTNLPQWKLFGKPTYSSFFYSYSKVQNNIVAGSSSPLDPYDFSREYGPSTSDGVHFLRGYFNLSLPKLFYLRGDFNIQTGSRFNIITGRDTNRDGIYAERPAFASNPNKPGVIRTPYGLLDPNPAPGDNLVPRNLARGPGVEEVNLYLSKTFGFHKDKTKKNEPRQRLNFSINVNNIFNKNNRGNPVGNLSSPNFLQFLSNSLSDGDFRSNSPRRMSLSTSFSF